MEAGLDTSLELQRRETMGIRTKHFGASFEAGLEAGLEGLKAMEIGENNVAKKVPVLVLKTYEKAGTQKWASPVVGRPDLGEVATALFSHKVRSHSSRALCARVSVCVDTLCETTLWVRVKRHAIHHWLYSLCTEDMWKVTARSHGRLVENTLLIAERILYVTILCHNILLVFGLVISDIRMMSLISVDQ